MKTLFTNATFHTMENAEDAHCSMLVEDGVIAAFDLSADDPHTQGVRTVDLQGAHVYPALIDAHLHLLEAVALSGISTQLCNVENGLIEPHQSRRRRTKNSRSRSARQTGRPYGMQQLHNALHG